MNNKNHSSREDKAFEAMFSSLHSLYDELDVSRKVIMEILLPTSVGSPERDEYEEGEPAGKAGASYIVGNSRESFPVNINGAMFTSPEELQDAVNNICKLLRKGFNKPKESKHSMATFITAVAERYPEMVPKTCRKTAEAILR